MGLPAGKDRLAAPKNLAKSQLGRMGELRRDMPKQFRQRDGTVVCSSPQKRFTGSPAGLSKSQMPRSQNPRVTIGVPAYNAERYLAISLGSLLEQTYTDIEILICDNASTDSTPDIAADFARRDARVRYVRNERNIGAGRNFIRCVDLARSELFRWQSADDYSAPTFIERCVEILDAHPDVMQAYPRAIVVDENGTELERYAERIETRSDNPRERYLHVMRNLGRVNAFFGVMRTDLLRRTGIHGSYIGADIVVQAEIALYGKLWEIPEYLFFRRMHAAAQSAMTADQRAVFLEPEKPRHHEMMQWRHLSERLRSVARSPLTTLEKGRLMGALVRDGIAGRDTLWAELVDSMRHRRSPQST